MKDTVYIVYRHGSNAANQSMCNVAVIGSTIAKNRAEAEHEFANECYANQWLEAKPASRCSRPDCDDAWDSDNKRREQRDDYDGQCADAKSYSDALHDEWSAEESQEDADREEEQAKILDDERNAFYQKWGY